MQQEAEKSIKSKLNDHASDRVPARCLGQPMLHKLFTSLVASQSPNQRGYPSSLHLPVSLTC